MPVESAQDRLAFFSLNEFGATSTIASSSSGQELDVVGIFDNQFLSLDLGAGSVTTSEPQFTCRTDDVKSEDFTANQGDTLTLDEVVWEIVDIQHDGTGMSVLRLHRK
jgi:hypothetical protein